jgi:seryl-tRNA synthetase
VLAIEYLRDNPDSILKAAQSKGDKVEISKIIELDGVRRKLLSEINELRAKRNAASQEIGEVKKAGGDAKNAIKAVQTIGSKIVIVINSKYPP